jgi:hypothetical protein
MAGGGYDEIGGFDVPNEDLSHRRGVKEEIKVPTDGKIPGNDTNEWLPPSVGATI